ncbi:MAG: hypothetical protein JW867_02765 [Candidatus Omnitrophica bacterium]|nr:hypothetical protein [Candidatus Omnitrophota bacterium]
MPGGDGKGPFGGGPGTGRGSGRGQGKGFSGFGGGFPGRGPGGYCVCSACGASVVHQPGTPCTSVNCPKCGAKMTRR